MLFQLKVPDQNVLYFYLFFFNSAERIFPAILLVVIAVYFSGTTRPFLAFVCQLPLLQYCTYVFEKYLMSTPLLKDHLVRISASPRGHKFK